MTSKERLSRCYRHEETDRPGLYIRGVEPKLPAHRSYARLREKVLARCDRKEWVWGWDVMEDPVPRVVEKEIVSEDYERRKSVLRTPAGDLWTSSMDGRKGQPGYHEKYLLESRKDAEKLLSLPDSRPTGDAESYFKKIAAIGDRGIVEVRLGSNPAGWTAELFGSERFAMLSLDDRPLLETLMELRMRRMIAVVNRLVALGVGPFFAMLGEEYIVPPLHSRQDFRDFNVRFDVPIVERIHDGGGRLHLHCHGPLRDLLADFVEIGVDVLHPVEPPPGGNVAPVEAKAAFRGKVCIEGNVQIADMYDAKPDEIREKVTGLVRDAWDDRRGLIVCPTASPFVPEATERVLENYSVLIDTVLSAGR